MFSIKESFGDCLSCPLFSEPSCILETNCDYFKEAEIIFIAENPGKDEVEKGRPLVGKAGKLFRKYFEKYNLHKMKYILSNVVLCQTLNQDGTTGNPTPEVIEKCKVNCFKIIEECNPKLIVLMGASPTSAFGLLPKGTGITNIRGEVFKWNNHNVLIMLHPSYINRQKNLEPTYEEDMKKVATLVGSDQSQIEVKKGNTGKSGVFYYKIPEKYYTSNYKLIDVQFLGKTSEVLYVFRDKDNKKEYYKTNDDYFCYQINDESKSRKTVPYDQLKQVKVSYKEKYSLNPKITYEGDLKITTKHSIDYYLLKKEEEPNIPINVMFLDIETYSKTKVLSNAADADDYIAIIRCAYGDKRKSFVLEPRALGIDQDVDMSRNDIQLFKSESQLLTSFINEFRNIDPDFVSGWYCLPKNSSVWKEDRIIPIIEMVKEDKLYKYGNVINKVETGTQKSYKLNMKHGLSISASENHIFPVYIKEKKKFFTKSHFFSGVDNKSVKEIKEELKNGKDVYFLMEKRINNNNDYTYRDLLVENFDKFLSFEYFDILISDGMYSKLKDNKLARKDLNLRGEYWNLKREIYKCHHFSFKKLLKYIKKEEIIDFLKTENIHHILFKNSRFKIDVSEVISSKDLELLGFMYTDGFWSKYDTNFHFDNKDLGTSDYYQDIINKKYLKKTKLTRENTWNKRDQLQSFYSLARNKFSILAISVYNNNIKKELDLGILSRLSFNQFCSFFNGLLDGDGSAYHNHSVSVCFCINNGRESRVINELLFWNNTISYIESKGDVVFIPGMNYNEQFLNNIQIHQSTRKKIFEESKEYIFKNSCSNNCNTLIGNDYLIIRLSNIEETEKEEMVDLTTTSHFFISGGFKTHNCNDFDMKYIFNRCKKINIDASKLSKFNEADYNKYQFYPDIAGCVCLDMLELYKTFTFGGRESYSLDFISNLELKTGKLDIGGKFSDQFRKDANKAIEYNRIDVELLEKLNLKLRHLFLIDELKRICKTSFKGAKSTMGQLDSLIVSFLKEKGYASKNAEVGEEGKKFEGAYVQSPIVGVHDLICDFDFTSLYPSLILTYNIGVNTFVMKLKDYTLGYDLVYNPDNLPEQIEVVIDPFFEKKIMTVTREQLLEKIKKSNLTYTINGCFYNPHDKEVSFYSQILEGLLGSRKEYKKKMFEAVNQKDKDKESLYDTRQLVYKVLANALYGILGNKVFRFFNVDCARSITLSGQEAIKNVMLSAENFIESKINKIPALIKEATKHQIMYLKEDENISNNFNNLITGDTDSVFVTYKNLVDVKKDKNEVLKEVNDLNVEVQDFLNNVVVKNIINKHNVPENKNKLSLKNELVIKRGLYLAKKRYVNYVVSVEGNTVDKIDGKGIETKRSDFANTTKEHLKEVIELILKSEKLSLPRVLDFIKEKEKEFIKIIESGKTVIGRPVSFGKKLKEYKVIPQGVKSMLNWNNLEYRVFDVGSRGYMFKIKGVDLDKAPEKIRLNYNKYFLSTGEKLEVIAIPEEEEFIPDYYVIDVKSMVKFSWSDRCDLLLEPLITPKQEILKF